MNCDNNKYNLLYFVRHLLYIFAHCSAKDNINCISYFSAILFIHISIFENIWRLSSLRILTLHTTLAVILIILTPWETLYYLRWIGTLSRWFKWIYFIIATLSRWFKWIHFIISGMFSEAYLGSILCKLCHYAAMGSTASSVFSIIAIALVKYRSVKVSTKVKPILFKFIGGSRGAPSVRPLPPRDPILSFWHTNFPKCSRLGSPCHPAYEVHAPYGS